MILSDWPPQAWIDAVKGTLVVYRLNGQIVVRTVAKPKRATKKQSRRG